MRLIVLFSLKPGVSHDDYRAWALERDVPTVRNLPSIASFDVLRTTGNMGGGNAPYEYIEIIDIADMTQFQDDVASETMQKIAAEFAKLANAVFVTTEAL